MIGALVTHYLLKIDMIFPAVTFGLKKQNERDLKNENDFFLFLLRVVDGVVLDWGSY